MRRGWTVVVTVVITLVVLAAAGLAVLYTGAYPVSAQAEHTALGRWVLETAKHRGIASALPETPAVPELTDAMAEAAAGRFAQTCAHCHGAPGIARADFAEHMRPQPPELSHAAGHMSPAELRWVIANGLRMTGMPAFGPLLKDDEVWGLVALIERLPSLDPRAFGALVKAAAQAEAEAASGAGQAETRVQTLGPGDTHGGAVAD